MRWARAWLSSSNERAGLPGVCSQIKTPVMQKRRGRLASSPLVICVKIAFSSTSWQACRYRRHQAAGDRADDDLNRVAGPLYPGVYLALTTALECVAFDLLTALNASTSRYVMRSCCQKALYTLLTCLCSAVRVALQLWWSRSSMERRPSSTLASSDIPMASASLADVAKPSPEPPPWRAESAL